MSTAPNTTSSNQKKMDMKIADAKLKIGDKNLDLDEIPDNIDISINLPKKKAPTATKTAKKPKNTIALF